MAVTPPQPPKRSAEERAATRTLVVCWIANFVTALGMMSFLPFFPSHLRALGVEEGNVALWAGICVGAAPFAAALMGPIWGALGDRFGRKMMVLRSLLGIFVFVGLMAFAQTPMQLLMLRIGQGIFSGFLAPSITLVTMGYPTRNMGHISGVLQSAMAAGSILGPLFGSALILTLPSYYMFATPAMLAGFAALLVGFLATEERLLAMASTAPKGTPIHRVVRSVLKGIGSSLVDLMNRPRMRLGLVFLFIAQFGIGATNPQLELFVGHVEPDWAQGKVQQHTAYLFSILAGVGLFAMPVWGRYGDRNGHGKVLVISALSAGIALCVSGFATVFWVLLVSRLLLGAFGSGLGPAAFGLAADVTGREERGAANGAVFSARALAISLGSIVGGVLVHFLGLRGIYIGSGCLLVIAVFAAGPRLLVRRADS